MTTILIIEDDIIMLTVMCKILSKSGYKVVTAKNGKEAFEKLDTEEYDLVITDLMMPYSNGLEIVSKLRSDNTKLDIGIIVVSCIGNKETITESFIMGVDSYLKKPIISSELLSTVKNLLDKSSNQKLIIKKKK
jgi:DNA-binding response OmpR family regulator